LTNRGGGLVPGAGGVLPVSPGAMPAQQPFNFNGGRGAPIGRGP
jgi:hypothetical protein